MAELTRTIFTRSATEAPGQVGAGPRPPETPTGARPPSKPRRRGTSPTWLGAAAIVALPLAAWIFWPRHGSRAVAAAAGGTTHTATIERRAFVRTLRLTGTTEAVQSRAVLAPELAGAQMSSLVITKLAGAGVKVKQSDLLVEFDRQGQVKNFLDKQAEYRDLIDQIARKQAEEDAARSKDETELKQAEDDLKKAELEMQKAPVLSKIDVEKNQETLDEARANLKALSETFDLKRRAALAGIRTLEIQRDRSRQAMEHAKLNEERMSIHSPMEGVVVLNSIWKEGKMGEVQEGDEVRPGVPFMQVVNPSAMQVRVKVNQADLLALREGMKSEVRLDAYSEIIFPAKLEQLAPIGGSGRFSEALRTFVALFSIEGSDPRLMPDLTAAVDVEIERRPTALVAPHTSIFTENGQRFVLLKRGLNFEKHPVRIGAVNDMDVVIESGLTPGDVVEAGGL